MTDESPYSKREQDDWRNEVRKLFDDQNKKLEKYDSTIALLSRVSTTNSGMIIKIQDDLREEKKATKLITDIVSFWKVTKWFVYAVVGLGSLYSALKVISLGAIAKLLVYLFK